MKLLLETISEMPPCLAAAMGIASGHELEKQQAFRKTEKFSCPDMGTQL